MTQLTKRLNGHQPTENIIMNEAGSVNHFTDDGNLPLFSNNVNIVTNAKVVVDCMA
jgi:hypothetical protein